MRRLLWSWTVGASVVFLHIVAYRTGRSCMMVQESFRLSLYSILPFEPRSMVNIVDFLMLLGGAFVSLKYPPLAVRRSAFDGWKDSVP